MAKNSMKLQYKNKKRERKNKLQNTSSSDELTQGVLTVIGVIAFLGVSYLIMIVMKNAGFFDAGYIKPSKGETTISYEYIPVGTLFNRTESEYLVLFDNYGDNTKDVYINYLLDKGKTPAYKVDMSLKENEKYNSTEANPKAKNPNEIKINDMTLIKIKKGKIDKYITGSENIEEYLTK